MFYIILTILVSVLILVGFKLFSRFGINSFQAIVVNYLTAAITGILFSDNHLSIQAARETSFMHIAIPLGLVFISIFYLISQTAQKISISTASIANKMSVVIPVSVAILFYDEKPDTLKYVGIAAALVAVVLTVYRKKENSGLANRLWWLPLLVFVGSGLIDAVLNAVNKTYIHSETESEIFTITTFASAFCCGILVLGYQLLTRKTTLELKNIIAGICLGIPNYFSIFFILKSLDSQVLSSATLFPVLNISNVALSALVGALLFREKLSRLNFAGLVLALLAIALLAF